MTLSATRSIFTFMFLCIFMISCTDDEILDPIDTDTTEETTEDTAEDSDDSNPTPSDNASSGDTTCTDPLNFVFNEKDGLVLVEFEDAEFTADWKLKTDGDTHSGTGYMVWEGSQSLGNPGNGTATFKLKIETPGTYQFIWHSAVTLGDNGTEHNDTWLRFNDASDFYAQKGTSTVYPKDTGKTPNPEGATKDGWFKIYRSGSNLDFKWQSSTYDNNAHDVFVVFNNAGTYLMEISARSSGHGIDKFALFNASVSKADAIASTSFSAISCD